MEARRRRVARRDEVMGLPGAAGPWSAAPSSRATGSYAGGFGSSTIASVGMRVLTV